MNDSNGKKTNYSTYSRGSSLQAKTASERSRMKLQRFFGVGNFETCQLDFMELCTSKYPGKKWDQLSIEQQVELVRDALKPKNNLLDPNCEYLKHWDMLILLALVYTSTVTPYEVGFLETAMNPLFIINRVVDFIFIKDMIMQFSLKVQVTTQKGTVWIRDRKGIATRYFKGWFFIDLVSVLPFDIVGFVLQDPEVQKLKVVRIVRLMRLLKLMRVLRASRIFNRWRNHTSLSFAAQGLLKFTILLVVIAHWMACIWGMMGVLLADADCSTSIYTYEEENMSWVTSHDWGPDSPCEHFDVYLASLHFSVMTITSIGYGDITPTRKEEHVLCIVCQLSGGLTWAYVIGSICGIISNSNPMRVAFEQGMDTLNAMLAEQNVEHSLCWRLREYLREQQYHTLLLRARQISEHFSPLLRGEFILDTAMGQGIQNVYYLQDMPSSIVVELAHYLRPMQYSPREEVSHVNQMNLVQRGSLARTGKILLPGNCWGEDMIIESQYLLNFQRAVALNYVEVLHLEKIDFNEVVDQYPHERKKINKAAARIAFRNALRLVVRKRLIERKGFGQMVASEAAAAARAENIFQCDEVVQSRAMDAPGRPALAHMDNPGTQSNMLMGTSSMEVDFSHSNNKRVGGMGARSRSSLGVDNHFDANWPSTQRKPSLAASRKSVQESMVKHVEEWASRNYDSLDRRFDSFDSAFEERFDSLNRRFDGFEERFGSLDRRFDGFERRFDGFQEELKSSHQRQDEMLAMLRFIEELVQNVNRQMSETEETRRIEPEPVLTIDESPMKLKRTLYCGGSFDKVPCSSSPTSPRGNVQI